MTAKNFNNRSPVEVHVASYSCPRLALPSEPLTRKRVGTWTNERRNAAIAAIASAIASGILESLWPFGLFTASAYSAASMPFQPSSWVTVVVESVDHAAILRSLLPEFGVLRANPPEPSAWHRLQVVTLAGMAECGANFAPNVVINAVGGKFALELPEAFDIRPPNSPAIIVELDDVFDDQAIKDTTNRLCHYGYRRWPVFPERRIPFPPLAIATSGRATKSPYQRLQERLGLATKTTEPTGKGGDGAQKHATAGTQEKGGNHRATRRPLGTAAKPKRTDAV
jgi:hypothetical protein